MDTRNAATAPRFNPAAIRHLESPAIRPLSHDFDCWRRWMLQAIIEMREAGVDRAIIESEVEATCRALRFTGGLDA